MKTNRRTGYGVYDLTRHIARRVRQEWETVESPPLPRRMLADIVPFPDRRDPWPPAAGKRPLAA